MRKFLAWSGLGLIIATGLLLISSHHKIELATTPVLKYEFAIAPEEKVVSQEEGRQHHGQQETLSSPPSAAPSLAVQFNETFVGGQIVSQLNQKCASIGGSKKANNVAFIQLTCRTMNNFRFTFLKQGDSFYQIQVGHSNMCMGVKGRSRAEGATVIQFQCQEKNRAQLWSIREGFGDSIQIVVRHTGMCLTVGGANPNDGAELVQGTCDTRLSNALWKFRAPKTTGPLAVPSTIGWKGPYRMNIVPVAAANLVDGRILTWAAVASMDFRPVKKGNQTWVAFFDPKDNSSSEALVKNTRHDMFCPGTAVLPDGRIAITGGSKSEAFTLYDPKNDSWTRGPDMNIPRGYHSMTMLPDGTVFTLGGSFSGKRGGKDGEVWDPSTSSNPWQIKDGIKAEGSLNTDDREGVYRSDNHMWLFPAPNGRLFHAGPSKQTHWIDVDGSGTVTESEMRDDMDAMNGNAVMYDIGKILTLGGSPDYENATSTNKAHVIDLNNGDNVSIRKVGDLHYRRTLCNSVVLPSGKVVVIGGQLISRIFTDFTAVFTAEIWDPETEEFTILESMTVPRAYHSVAILMKDGRIWVGGGGLCGKCKYNHPDAEILTPPYLLDANGNSPTRPIILSATSSTHPGGIITANMDTDGDHTFALVRLNAVTHSINNDGRRIPLDVMMKNGASYNLAIPANPAVALPGSYFLFAMNSAGVPSVASILKIDL